MPPAALVNGPGRLELGLGRRRADQLRSAPRCSAERRLGGKSTGPAAIRTSPVGGLAKLPLTWSIAREDAGVCEIADVAHVAVVRAMPAAADHQVAAQLTLPDATTSCPWFTMVWVGDRGTCSVTVPGPLTTTFPEPLTLLAKGWLPAKSSSSVALFVMPPATLPVVPPLPRASVPRGNRRAAGVGVAGGQDDRARAACRQSAAAADLAGSTTVPAPLVVSPPPPLTGPEIASVSPGFVTVTIALVSKATGAAIAWLPALSVRPRLPCRR